MINGWNKQYHVIPIIEGDFDFYKITFPTTTTTTSTNTGTLTSTNTGTLTSTNTGTLGDAREKEIMEFISNNPHLSTQETAKHFGLSRQGVRYHIDNLKKKGLIKRKGHGKGGSWEILT